MPPQLLLEQREAFIKLPICLIDFQCEDSETGTSGLKVLI